MSAPMRQFVALKGCKAAHVSREQIRSFLNASVMILGYHNRAPAVLPVVVTVKKGMVHLGYHLGGRISIRADLSPEDMLTTCLHEVIHACVRFPDETKEKCTTTLCARLKPDVLKLAGILLEGTYRRAAYLAHTKIRYPTVNGDYYDTAEDLPLGVVGKYHRRKGDGKVSVKMGDAVDHDRLEGG